MLSGRLAPDAGQVAYRMRDGVQRDIFDLSEAERRLLLRTDWVSCTRTRRWVCA